MKMGTRGFLRARRAGSQAASAQADVVDYSDHPLCGRWLVMADWPSPASPQVPVPSLYTADGTVVLAFPVSQTGAEGVVFYGGGVGVWEPYDESTGHFTVIQTISDIDGTFLSSVTIDGHPHVNEDGNSFIDDGSLVTVTIRDASGAVVMEIPPGVTGRPVTGVRMGVGAPGFPGDDPDATPVS